MFFWYFDFLVPPLSNSWNFPKCKSWFLRQNWGSDSRSLVCGNPHLFLIFSPDTIHFESISLSERRTMLIRLIPVSLVTPHLIVSEMLIMKNHENHDFSKKKKHNFGSNFIDLPWIVDPTSFWDSISADLMDNLAAFLRVTLKKNTLSIFIWDKTFSKLFVMFPKWYKRIQNPEKTPGWPQMPVRRNVQNPCHGWAGVL